MGCWLQGAEPVQTRSEFSTEAQIAYITLVVHCSVIHQSFFNNHLSTFYQACQLLQDVTSTLIKHLNGFLVVAVRDDMKHTLNIAK